jgi:simple sugar transport system ATP-binding protein
MEKTKSVIAEYDIKTPGINVPISFLSGGNQQKLIVAREFTGNPNLIVAFQPTRGLDIGASEFIQQKLLEKRTQGCAVLLISADLDEIRNLSDRIVVMYKGEFLGDMDNTSELDMTKLGMLMAGNRDIVKEDNL